MKFKIFTVIFMTCFSAFFSTFAMDVCDEYMDSLTNASTKHLPPCGIITIERGNDEPLGDEECNAPCSSGIITTCAMVTLTMSPTAGMYNAVQKAREKEKLWKQYSPEQWVRKKNQ